MTTPREVLDFWFGEPGSPEHGRERDFWFTKSAATDELIRARFGADTDAALRGEREPWAQTVDGTRALILLLDQFTRNIFRGTPRAFAGDARALQIARQLVSSGADRTLAPMQRWFVYLPFEHSESIDVQRESLRLFGELAAAGHPDALRWAQKHYDVIARFGRYPHRNDILGRASTPEELAFLAQPGAGF
ncbi:MAG: DUF924 family protein [Gemmatimonadota bacterium]